MAVLTRRSNRCAAIHPEAADWVRRVGANGGGVTPAGVAALSRLFYDLYAANIRDRFHRFNPFLGTGLASVTVPAILGPSFGGTTFGNTTDTNVNFVAGDFNETGSSSGLTGNGSTKYLNTGFPANTLTATDAHLSFSLMAAQSSTNADKTAIGAYTTASSIIYGIDVMRSSSNTAGVAGFGSYTALACFFGQAATFGGAGALAAGNILASSGTSSAVMYRNASAVGTTTTSRSNYPSAHSLYIFGNNNGAGGGGAVNITNARIASYSFGLNMTSTQATAFNAALTLFNSALSRS
jgi:hypothetical protein